MKSFLCIGGRILVLMILISGVAFLTTCRSTSSIRKSPVTLTVSAAADLTPAFEELGGLFEKETGTEVTFNFGSTGQLTQQIEQGAPVDLLAAANVSFVEDLERKNLIVLRYESALCTGTHHTLDTQRQSLKTRTG